MEKCSYHKGNVIYFPEIEDLHDDHNNYTELVCDLAYLICNMLSEIRDHAG